MRTFQRISRLIRPSVGLPVLSALAILGLLVLAMGCGETREPPGATAPAIDPRLPDVPVPAGFKFIRDKSSDRLVGGFRFVEYLYEGDASTRLVSNFYRNNMPVLGWKLVQESFTDGRQRFMFDKGNDTCHVSIWDSWGTKVFLKVLPKGARPTVEPRPPSAGPSSSLLRPAK